MHNYRLTIQYDGGRYKGWQRLGSGENTIQGKIERVLSELAGVPVEIIGCSRTDAGVHALAQVANFKLDQSLTESEIKQYLRQYLPQDIVVREVMSVGERWHARHAATAKTYLYRIWNEPDANPFMRKYSMHVEQRLGIPLMEQAAQQFLGKHDFTAFSNVKSKTKSMVREIYSIQIARAEGFVDVRVRGDGFLYNMVRYMVGTLIAVGLGELAPDEVPQLIANRDRHQVGRMAEACGLYLEQIDY